MDDVAYNVDELLHGQQQEYKKRIADWLAAPDPNPFEGVGANRRLPLIGTGEWFLSGDDYQQWKSGPSWSDIWINGKFGCGKTNLCSTIIEDLQESLQGPAEAVVYFFFSFAEPTKQKYHSFLSSAIYQLYRRSDLLQPLQSEYEMRNPSRPGVASLEAILSLYIQRFDRVYLVLDALDECPEGSDVRRNVLAGVTDMSNSLPNLRILTTSRPELDIHQHMMSMSMHAVELRIDDICQDIALYVDQELQTDVELRRLSEGCKSAIKSTLTTRADGV